MAAFASMAAMRWCDALLPVFADEFSSTAGQVSAVIYGYAIAYGLMQMFYGPFGDRFGKFRVVSLAALACTLGALASAAAPGLGWLTLARVLTGATAAGIIPMAIAWVGDQVPFEQRQPVLARLMSATVTGMIAGQWLSGVFADAFGWRLGFVVVALVFAVAGVAMQRSLRHGGDDQHAALAPDAGEKAPSSAQRARAVLSIPHARRVMLLVALEGAVAIPAMAFAPSHLHEKFGVAVSSAGAILALYGVGGLIYSRTAGWLLRRFPQFTLARAGGVGVGAMWIAFALAPSIGWTMPLCLLAGVGFHTIHNTLQTLGSQMAPAQRGTAMAMFASSLFLGQSVGMSSASWLVDHSSTTVVLVVAGSGLLLIGLVVRAALEQPAAAGVSAEA